METHELLFWAGITTLTGSYIHSQYQGQWKTAHTVVSFIGIAAMVGSKLKRLEL